jgi:hypothetical protein
VTVEEFVRSVFRRWPLLLVGLLITGIVGVIVWKAPGVYWASSKVYLLVPSTSVRPNQLAPNSPAAIAFAGLIEVEVNGGIPPRRATSPDVTLVDEGIYDGSAVFMPDTGGQWAHDFPESSLIVQASGPSAEVVRSRMYDLIGRIIQVAAAREDTAHVPEALRVDFTMSPTVVAVQYSNGHRSRAVAIIALLGIGLSLAACRVADRAFATRRRRGDTNDSIGDARVRDAAGGDQDGAGREGAAAPSLVAADRGGDRTTPGDA